MIIDRISSHPSPCDPSGEKLNEREFRGVDCRVLAPGELARDRVTEDGLDGRSVVADWLRTDSESDGISGEDWRGSEKRGFVAEGGGTAGENEGGGLTGGASPGDVMDAEKW